jgi:hypothetical protein
MRRIGNDQLPGPGRILTIEAVNAKGLGEILTNPAIGRVFLFLNVLACQLLIETILAVLPCLQTAFRHPFCPETLHERTGPIIVKLRSRGQL